MRVMVGNRHIGFIENGVFTKRVDGRIHRLRVPSAWAIDAPAFRDIIKPNCHKIEIIDEPANLRYEVSMETFDKFKGRINRGYGEQYFLTLDYWSVYSMSQATLPL